MRVDVELEKLLAVERQDGYSLAVTVVQSRVERDVHLLELELALGANALDHPAGLVTEVTARLAVEGDGGHGLSL